jgi:hypothetical protein
LQTHICLERKFFDANTSPCGLGIRNNFEDCAHRSVWNVAALGDGYAQALFIAA